MKHPGGGALVTPRDRPMGSPLLWRLAQYTWTTMARQRGILDPVHR